MPKRESEEDRRNQELFLQFFKDWILPEGKHAYATGEYVTYDFVVTESSNTITSINEFKRRHNEMHKYPTYTVDMDKIYNACQFSAFLNVPAFLHIGWDDTTRYVTVTPDIVMRYFWGGRTDRDNPNDQRIMAEIPLELFKNYGGDVKNLSWETEQECGPQ